MVSLPVESRWSIKSLSDDDAGSALAFLRRDPLINVYLISRLLEERFASATQMVEIRYNGEVILMASLATNIVLAADPAAAPVGFGPGASGADIGCDRSQGEAASRSRPDEYPATREAGRAAGREAYRRPPDSGTLGGRPDRFRDVCRDLRSARRAVWPGRWPPAVPARGV